MFDNYDEYCRHYGEDIEDDYDEVDFGDLVDVAYEASKVD